MQKMMTAEEVAEVLGVPLATLYQWRWLDRGPRASKIGRHLRYREADVEAFVEAQAGKAA